MSCIETKLLDRLSSRDFFNISISRAGVSDSKVGRSSNGATAGSYPGTRPGAGNDPHNGQYSDCEHGIQEESNAIGASVLFGLSEQVREDSATEGTDLADHTACNCGSERP